MGGQEKGYFPHVLKLWLTEGWRDGPVIQSLGALVEDSGSIPPSHMVIYSL